MVMRDIKKGPRRLNLSYKPQIIIPFRKILKISQIIFAVSFLAFGLRGLAPTMNGGAIFAAEEKPDNEERVVLEAQLADLEKQIDDYEVTIIQYRKQGQTLKSEISQLNAKISKLSLQIKAVNISLDKLDREIGETQNKITTTENDIGFNKAALAQALQNLYENERKSLVEILLANSTISDFFTDLNSLVLIQDSLRLTVKKIDALRDELLDQKEQLSLERADAEELKRYQDSQKDSIQKTQSQKSELLASTRGQESKFKELLKETQKSAAQIRSRIFEFLGGGEMSFEEAYEFAKIAEGATGVRAAFILAVLDRESALGQNVGRCAYQTAMHPKRDLPVFLALLDQLKAVGKAPPDPIMVSCPNRDGYFGGAMGPAQFIPSTWKLYANRVSEITGNTPSNPWNNGDAFVATALYLKDALNACGSYSGIAKERCAAARYYAGSRWQRHLWTYGERVVTKAETFQKDIDILNS